jgi:hypothetical protein
VFFKNIQHFSRGTTSFFHREIFHEHPALQIRFARIFVSLRAIRLSFVYFDTVFERMLQHASERVPRWYVR